MPARARMTIARSDTAVIFGAATIATAFRLLNIANTQDDIRRALSQDGYTVLVVEVCLSMLRLISVLSLARRHGVQFAILAFYGLGAELLTNVIGMVTKAVSYSENVPPTNPTLRYMSMRRLRPLSTAIEVSMLFFMLHSPHRVVITSTAIGIIAATALTQSSFSVIVSDLKNALGQRPDRRGETTE
eukprot:6211202-Pleurochrysis_carterae.AAC.3